jgi:hypothetical protein
MGRFIYSGNFRVDFPIFLVAWLGIFNFSGLALSAPRFEFLLV